MNLKDKNRILDIVKGLLSCPTAPFHEEEALQYIKKILRLYKIPFREDSGGNVIAHLQTGKGKSPSIAYVAHTDHPGIHVTRRTREEVIGHFLGGVDLKMMKGIFVNLFSRQGKVVKGKIIEGKLFRGKKRVRIAVSDPAEIASGDFGMFRFPGCRVRNGKIYSRAIDDLLGCAAILNLLIRLAGSEKNLNLYGIFTRAEEVGFIGAHHIITRTTIPQNTLMISVETSKAYPFAVMGGGPVLRIGDKATLFDPGLDLYFNEVAENLQKKNPSFKFQRLLMPGGTCEASPFSLAGYRTFGIAFPLGNYHNMSPGGKIRPEHIDLNDFFNGIVLMEALTKNLSHFKKREADLAHRMKKNYLSWKKMLLASSKKGQGFQTRSML